MSKENMELNKVKGLLSKGLYQTEIATILGVVQSCVSGKVGKIRKQNQKFINSITKQKDKSQRKLL